MSVLKIIKKSHFLIFIIFLVSLATRTIYLKSIPISLHPDEKIYAANAQSLINSGSDLKGSWQFWKLKPLTSMHAELPTVIMAIGFLFTRDISLAPKIISVIFSLTLPFILAGINQALFKKKNIFLLTFIVASFNPWVWQFGRMGFDALYGLWFYFLAILIILKAKSFRKLFSLPFIFLGFFQYQGLKIILAPVFLLLIAHQLILDFKNKNKFKKNLLVYGIVGIFITALFGYYFLVKLPVQQAGNRVTNGSIFSSEYLNSLGNVSNLERRRSLPSTLNKVASNKIAILVKNQLHQFFKIFNPINLFINNDAAFSEYSVWSKGLFYLGDLLIVLAFILIKNKPQTKDRVSFLLLGSLFFVGSLPAFINITNNWFTHRASFSFMIMTLFVSYFATFIFNHNKKLFAILAIFYTVGIMGFAYDYFYRYPIYSANGLYFNEKILSEYLSRNSNRQIHIYSNSPESYFDSYLYYGNNISKENIAEINQGFGEDNIFEYKNVRISNSQCILLPEDNELIIRDVDIPFCEKNKLAYFSISSLVDSGEISKIYGDSLCIPHTNKMNQYLRVSSLNDFDFSSLTNEEFCSKWITDLSKL